MHRNNVAPMLVGRHEETALLSKAYDNISRLYHSIDGEPPLSKSSTAMECVLISGPSGTGKTTLAHSILPRLHHDGGFFVSGKFELAATLRDPFAVFVTAFTHFVESLLEDAAQGDDDDDDDGAKHKLDRIRAVVQEALDTEAKYLVNVIPSLETLTGPQGKVGGDMKGSDATNLFQIAFCRLCYALSAIAPLVLFLDDLQWSDKSSMELLQSLLVAASSKAKTTTTNENVSSSRILVILAYRDDETYDGTYKTATSKGMKLPFLGYLQNFVRLSANKSSQSLLNLTQIYLESFGEDSLHQLVSSTLDIPLALTRELAHVIFTKSNGNPFFALQLLNLLTTQGYISREQDTAKNGRCCCWQWNIHDIEKACESAVTVDELVRNKVIALPALAKQVFQIGACMGDELDENAIALVLGMDIPEFEMHIQAGQAEGLVEFQRHVGRFRFCHDRIRHVVLSTIHDDKDAMMFRVGHLLWTKASVLFLAQKMFLVASLLNHGTKLMNEPTERYRAASLNLEAGIKAAALAAFPDSSRYLAAGIEFLTGGGNDYWSEQYDLSLNLFSTAADTEICNQNFDRVTQLTDEVLHNARTIQDKLRVYAAKINSLGQRGMFQEAIGYGVDVLQQLGQPLPQKATIRAIVLEVIKTKFVLSRFSDEQLMSLPYMTDPTILSAIHVMSILIPYTYQAASNYDPLIGTRILRMCLKHGYHNVCAAGFTTFGWLLCGSGNTKEGYKLGSMALAKLTKGHAAREMIPRLYVSFYSFINHWRNHIRTSTQPLEEAVRVGMEIGDVEYAMIALKFKCSNALSCGVPLPQVEEMMIDACQKMKLYQQESLLETMKMTLQYIHNLTGRAPNRLKLEGLAFADYNPTTEFRVNWVCYHFLSANVAFGFGDVKLALQISKARQTLAFKPKAMFFYAIMRQVDALIAIANAREDPRQYRQYAYKVSKQVMKEFRRWAKDCPDNFYHRQKLMEAEIRSLKLLSSSNRNVTNNRNVKSIKSQIDACYKESVERALKQGFIADVGIISELRGNHYHRQGEMNLAHRYWQDSYAYLLKWGATEKAAYVRDRHYKTAGRANIKQEQQENPSLVSETEEEMVGALSIIKD